MYKRKSSFFLAVGVVFAVTGCSRAPAVEGRYNMIKGPIENVVVDFGKSTFVLSSGASGTYETSNGQVILTGMTFAGSFKIEGDKLIGPNGKIELQRRTAEDKSPIYMGPQYGSGSMPSISGSGGAPKSTPQSWSVR